MIMRATNYLIFSGLALCSLAVFAGDKSLYFIDAHSQVDQHVNAATVIRLMDQAGVKQTILAARGKARARTVYEYASTHPNRIVPAVRTKGRHYKNNSEKYFQKLQRQLQSGRFKAMGELILYHAQKGNKAGEVIVYPRDRRVKVALAAARSQHWPLVVHIEFAALNGKRKRKFLQQLQAMLKNNPKHAFVLIHLGQLKADEAKPLLQQHPNLYLLTSHANTIAVRRSNQPWENMFKGKKLKQTWRNLILKHPDRFIFALDNVWSEHWGSDYLLQVKLWRQALRGLPPHIAHAIAHGNAERLWRLR